MYIYRVTFLGGGAVDIRANSPKEAWDRAAKAYSTCEIIRIKYIRG